jgi:hypothetical protein
MNGEELLKSRQVLSHSNHLKDYWMMKCESFAMALKLIGSPFDHEDW